MWLLIWNKIEKLKLIATFHFLYSALLPIESDLTHRNKNHLEEGDHLGQGLLSFFNVDPPAIRDATRPNWARKVRELIMFNVLCTVYCGRGCVSLESEKGKELAFRV